MHDTIIIIIFFYKNGLAYIQIILLIIHNITFPASQKFTETKSMLHLSSLVNLENHVNVYLPQK